VVTRTKYMKISMNFVCPEEAFLIAEEASK